MNDLADVFEARPPSLAVRAAENRADRARRRQGLVQPVIYASVQKPLRSLLTSIAVDTAHDHAVNALNFGTKLLENIGRRRASATGEVRAELEELQRLLSMAPALRSCAEFWGAIVDHMHATAEATR